MISNITDTVLEEIEEWKKRPLKEVYPIVFIDAIHFNVKQENIIVKKASYVVLMLMVLKKCFEYGLEKMSQLNIG